MQKLDLISLQKFDIKAINLNRFYDEVQNELGIKKSSFLEMGVKERTHHVDKTRIVTTTQIAAGHEYGNSFTPSRPFLHTSANEFVNGDFSKDVKQEYTYLGAFLKRLAKKLYATVVECFMSGGFGKWLPLTDNYKQRTGRTDPPLLNTGKLLSSVYVRYEGYTISGKNTGGMISSDLGQEVDTKKDVPKSISTNKVKTQRSTISIKKPSISPKEDINKSAIVAQQEMERRIVMEKQSMRNEYMSKYGAKKYIQNKSKLEEEFFQMALKKIMGNK